MSNQFTQLHNHTEFSLLDGAIKIGNLLEKAKKQEWKSIAISDHGNIFGAVKFFQLAQKEKIKPILGIEMYFTPDITIKNINEKYHHLLIIVQNSVGYKNLCKLSKISYQDGFYFKPRIDYAALEKHSEGLIVTTACCGGHIPALLREGNTEEARARAQWFIDLFGPDRFFFEYQPPEFDTQIQTNNLLMEFSKQWPQIKGIASCDAHYIGLEDREAHEVMLSIQTKGTIDDPDRYSFGDCRAYLRTTEEMLAAFPNNPELLWNTQHIVDQCDFAFEFGKLFFPQFPVPEPHDANSYFSHLCAVGLQKLKDSGRIPQEKCIIYDARLQEEIDLIIKMGFVGYFLVVGDFIQWAKRQLIPVGPGRGSAAGSLVAWSLEITNIDPIRYNLLFERFLNPERISMPDIDIDFCIERREEVINYVKDKYGHNCVCQIVTFGTMMAKGVIKDVARVLGFPFQDANAITDLIPDQLKITLRESIDQEPRLKALIDSNPKVKQVFDISFKLEGLTRHASKHAAGVVISPMPLDECLPIYTPSRDSDDVVCQFAMTELEAVGFLKMDFLGLKNLTIVERALKAITRNHNLSLDLDTIPLDDPRSFKLLQDGKTKGVFQFESEGIQEVLRKLQPDKFEDLIAVNALYRPGPLGSGMVDDYIDRRHGRKKTTYMFPELEPILAETYGVIVYQEQVIKIASAIAGYSLGAADILRRAMGKKKAEVMAQQKELFVAGAQKGGFDITKSGELFDLMAYFAGYGFNKSHSAAYALIAYQTAYLKANYPREFMASLVSFETSNPDEMTKYLQEIRDMNIALIAPDVNRSHEEFFADEDGIVFGLRGVKSVGGIALQSIFEERAKKPFTDLLDLCVRVDLRTVNKRVLENLTYGGALDTLHGNRAQKIAELDTILDRANSIKENKKTGQTSLFGGSFGQEPIAGGSSSGYAFQPRQEWSSKELLEHEKEVVGFYLSSHPLKSYPIISFIQCDTFGEALEKGKNVTSIKEPFVTCCCMIHSYKVITTKKGDRMAFATAEDLSGHAELIVFPKTFVDVERLLESHHVFVIKGAVDITATTNCKIKVNQFIPVEAFTEKTGLFTSVNVILPEGVDEAKLKELKALFKPGSVPVSLSYTENNQKLMLMSNDKVACDYEWLSAVAAKGFLVQVGV